MKKLDEEQLEAVLSFYSTNFGTENLKNHLKEKGLIKEELEVGKWYKYSDREGFLFCITNVLNYSVDVYGFNSWGNWIDEGAYSSKNLIPATDKEVVDALIKEAKKRGIKEGVKIKKMVSRRHEVIAEGMDINWLSNRLAYDYLWIFKNGKWAEIIEEKKEIVVNGVTYIEK